MNVANQLNGLKQSLSTFWSERNKREQNMLLAAVAVVVLGLAYALLLDPALSGRDDLEEKLPALRQQAAEVRSLAREASALRGKAATPPPLMTRESIEASLARRGLKPQSATVSGELARLQFSGVSFATLIDWLDEMQRTARLSVAEANIEALTEPDRVNASLTLRQQRSEQNQ